MSDTLIDTLMKFQTKLDIPECATSTNIYIDMSDLLLEYMLQLSGCIHEWLNINISRLRHHSESDLSQI